MRLLMRAVIGFACLSGIAALAASFLQAALEVFLILLDQFGIFGSAVDFAGFVLPFGKFLFGPIVMYADFVSAVEDILDELRRDEIDAFTIPDDEITGHYGDAADADGHVDAGKHDVVDGGGINVLEIGGHVDFRNAIEISNAAVDHQTAAFCRGHHIEKKIVADYCSADFLAEDVDNEDIAGLEHVNGSLVGQMRQAALLGFGVGDVFEVWPLRHELNCKGTANHGLIGMENAEAVGELVVEAFFLQDRPDFLGGELARLSK
jgi:hypothetical protein